MSARLRSPTRRRRRSGWRSPSRTVSVHRLTTPRAPALHLWDAGKPRVRLGLSAGLPIPALSRVAYAFRVGNRQRASNRIRGKGEICRQLHAGRLNAKTLSPAPPSQ
jgi:hypothetical protein